MSIDKNKIKFYLNFHLHIGQTRINDTEHYPTQAARIQLGIWDASTPEGTSEWAKGPIDWETAPSTISAIVKRVQVECP